MKARFLFLAAMLLSLGAISCEKTNGENETEKAILTANPLSLSFTASGAPSQDITVESKNVSWTVSLENECDWITFQTTNNIITVTVSDNLTFEPRNNRIVITPDEATLESVYVSVEQDAMDKPEATTLKADALATYYGMDFMYSTNNNGEWLIELYTEETDIDIQWNEFGKEGYWSGSISSGRAITLYMYCDPAEDFFNPTMVPGEYNPCNSNDDIDNMTFTLSQDNPNGLPWPNGSYIVDYSNGSSEYTYITDGKVEVETDGGKYNINLYIVTEDGDEVYYTYTGEPHISILGNPPYYSDLTDDLSVGNDELSSASSYFAESYNPDYTIWNIQVVGTGIESDASGNVTGEGPLGYLQFVSLTSAGTGSIPEGTYTIDTEYNIYDPYAGGAIAGKYDPLMGNSGSYFNIYSSEGMAFAPINEGTIEITNLGDGNYRVEVAGEDDNNHSISVTYEGAIAIL